MFELDLALSRYRAAAKKLGEHGSSATLGSRRNIEQEYALSAKVLMQNGYMYPLKKKYTNK